MSDRYVQLIGADDVRSAGHTMARAAETMVNAASTMDSAVRRLEIILDDQITRLERILAEDREKRFALTTVTMGPTKLDIIADPFRDPPTAAEVAAHGNPTSDWDIPGSFKP